MQNAHEINCKRKDIGSPSYRGRRNGERASRGTSPSLGLGVVSWDGLLLDGWAPIEGGPALALPVDAQPPRCHSW